MNVVYLHLLRQFRHEERCTPDMCVHSCDVQRFLASLQRPVLAADIRRAEALSRGEIPGQLAG